MMFLICTVILAHLQGETAVAMPSAGSLIVEARASDMLTTSNPLTILVDLRNSSIAQDITVDTVEVALPGQLTFCFSETITTPSDFRKPIVLGPGRSTSLKADYSAKPSLKRLIKSLGYRSTEYQITVQTRYRIHEPDASPESKWTTLSSIVQVSVLPRAGLSSIIVGGSIGVLLSSLLALLRTMLEARKAKTDLAGPLARRLSNEALTALYGILVTTAAIYLLQATTVPEFPVSISLRDPLGGLILGMFFRPVGQVIQGKFS